LTMSHSRKVAKWGVRAVWNTARTPPFRPPHLKCDMVKVATGEVPTEWGRLLNEKLEVRSRALYDPLVTITRQETEVVCADRRAG